MRNTIFKLVLFVFPYLLPSFIQSQSPGSQLTIQANSRNVQVATTGFSAHEIIGTIVWLGINNNWNDPQNWFLSTYPDYGLPTTNTDVLIQTVPSGIYPVIAKNQVGSCNHLTITAGGPQLTIINGGDLNCFGDINNNGTITNNGKLNLMGVGIQNFPGPGTIAGMNILQVSKSAGTAVLNRNFYIDSALLPTSGVLNLGNFDITLKSGPARTAYVGNVGSPTGFTYGTGRFIVQRYISQTRRWQLLSVPTNGTQSVFDAWQDAGSSTTSPTGFGLQVTGPVVANGIDAYSPGWSLKSQQGCTGSFIPVTNTLDPLLNQKGYFVYVYGNRGYSANSAAGPPTTLQTRGKLFVGNQVSADQPGLVTATANIVDGDDHMSVGNPFAAPINFTSLLNHSLNSAGNFKSNFKVWDPSQDGLYGSGMYQTITGPTGWLATPGGGNIFNSPSNFSDIQSGQAFYVEAINTGAVSVRFSESIKSVQNRLVNRGVGTYEEIDPSQVSMLSAFLFNNNAKLLDGNRVVFDNQYTSAIDQDDAGKLWNHGANFSILKNSQSLAVEARPLLHLYDTIQYEIYDLWPGSYQFSIVPQLISAPTLQAFLIDRYLHTEKLISLVDSSHYSFSVNADPQSSSPNRFYLLFRKKPAPLEFVSFDASWLGDQAAKLKWKVLNQQHTLSFQLEHGITANQFQNIGDTFRANGNFYETVHLSPDPSLNYYRIKAINHDGEINYSNIISLSKIHAEKIIVAPNPVENKTLRLQAKNFGNGNYNLQIWNAAGALLHNHSFSINAYISNLAFYLPETIPAGNYQIKIIGKDLKPLANASIVVR